MGNDYNQSETESAFPEILYMHTNVELLICEICIGRQY